MFWPIFAAGKGNGVLALRIFCDRESQSRCITLIEGSAWRVTRIAR
jgi:hypothetical protein